MISAPSCTFSYMRQSRAKERTISIEEQRRDIEQWADASLPEYAVHGGRSQDTQKGNRPSFSHAGGPERAEPLYEAFCEALETEGVRVARGVFGARMEVELVNQGPVTIVIET